MKTKALFFAFLCLALSGYAQRIYYTQTHDPKIKTLKVCGAGQLDNPIIELNSGQVHISFDELSPEMTRFAYRLIHCDADWKQSALMPIEYMDGFQGLPIDDYDYSGSTSINYCHYRLSLPNEDVGFRVSGNYAVEIYRDDEPSRPVLTACLSVVESLVRMGMEVSSRTDIDLNKEHQQVSFVVDYPGLPVSFPQNDFKLYVFQNNRRDNSVTGLTPSMISRNRIEFFHNRNLIFKAGNEFRRFEFQTIYMPGMNVQELSYHEPYYHLTLFPDAVKTRLNYRYDEDQNGRFYTNTADGSDPDRDAYYEIVHFFLPMGKPLPNGNLYLFSEIYQFRLNEQSRIAYNPDAGGYETAILLKQGSYNYQYLFVPNGSTKGETYPVEGDKYETENEYRLMVYYRPMNEKYDRLVGVQTVHSNPRPGNR